MCAGDKPGDGTEYQTPASLKPVDKASAVNGDLVVEEVPITLDGYTYPYGRIAYIKGRGPAPVILVHHHYAGLQQFHVNQACFLAKVGYVGLCVDLYQETKHYTYVERSKNSGKRIDFDEFCAIVKTESILEESMGGTPPLHERPVEALKGLWDTLQGKDEHGKIDWYGLKHFVGAFTQMQGLLKSPDRWRRLMAAYLEEAFKHPAVKRGLAGSIGYCLGGQSCLEQLRAGHTIQAIVGFHGLLHSRPMYPEECFNSLRRITKEEYANQYKLDNVYTPGCRVLMENGAHDLEIPQASLDEWIAEMDENKVDWRFDNHARGPHGFALPKGIPGGDQYSEHIDRRSCLAMLSLFAETWPEYEQYPVECNACGTKLGQFIVPGDGKRRSGSSKTPKTPNVALAAAGALVVAMAFALFRGKGT